MNLATNPIISGHLFLESTLIQVIETALIDAGVSLKPVKIIELDRKDAVSFISSKGQRYIMPLDISRLHEGTLGLKSVLREHDQEEVEWDEHGHPLSDTKDVIVWSENQPIIQADRNRFKSYVATMYGLSSFEDIRENIRSIIKEYAQKLNTKPQLYLPKEARWLTIC